MTGGWLPQAEWDRIQGEVPIACVDALALRFDPQNPAEPESIGLILRDEPDVGRRWCLIGGRVLYQEPLLVALARHLRSTLGAGVEAATMSAEQPLYVAQYFPIRRPGFGHDPRKHSIGLTFAVTLSGPLEPQGEALDFHWFRADALPTASEFGFGQDEVVSACLGVLRDRRGGGLGPAHI